MFDPLEILLFTFWTIFVVYATWYFTSAKHYAPLTYTEAKILWSIHKQSVKCNSKKWKPIKRGNKIVGYECECGYKHVQKRPIVGNTPLPTVHQGKMENNVFNKLHTSYE